MRDDPLVRSQLRFFPGATTALAAVLLGGILLGGLLLGGCQDNIGRAFDPKKGGGSTPGAALLQPPPAGGIVLDARPRVEQVWPSGSGAQSTTPVVILFSEAMNFESLTSSTTEEPSHVILRARESTDALAATYDLLLGGRLLVIRPQTPLLPSVTYEVVAGKGVRDIDRATLQKVGVLASFTADSPLDAGPKVVATFPSDNDNSILRESEAYIFFSQPVTATTVTETSLFLRKKGAGSNLSAPISFPLRLGFVPDPRAARLDPSVPFDAGASIELRYTKDIKANDIDLDVGTKVPPVTFQVNDILGVEDMAIGNASPGFANRVNLANLTTLTIAVDVPVGTKIGDRVAVRIYGGDPKSSSANVLVFVEEVGVVTADGPGTVSVSLGPRLGTATSSTFDDGALTIAARLSRGSQITGYVVATGTAQDTTRPTLTKVGPPAGSGTSVAVVDLSAVALIGTASEEVGELSLTVGSSTYTLFGADAAGRFMSQAFLIGQTTAPTPFVLNLTDTSGNLNAVATNGSFVQRGVLTGSVSGGTLSVTAYDESTLGALSGVSVLIEPGMPAKPASGRQTKTTDANGIATFTGLTAPTYSITLVKSGYDLTSVLATAVGYASLPMRPTGGSTATLSGSLAFTPVPGVSARVGVNLLEDETADHQVDTATATPTALPTTKVLPNRPLLVTAFAGPMPPPVRPTYGVYSVQIGASSGGLGANRPPPEAKAALGTYALNLPLVTSLNATINFLATYGLDLSTATGLDTSKLDGPPRVSVVASVNGFGGMVLAGVGFATGSAATWTIDGSFSLGFVADFVGSSPILWSSTQASDTSGNLSRNRALVGDQLLGLVAALAPVAAIPTVTTPSGSFTGSPLVVVADRLDTGVLVNTFALRRIRATDANGRRWTLLVEDTDAAGGTDSIQLPDLAGSGATGLATGSWSIRAEDFLLLSLGSASATDLCLSDIPRLEVTYARSKAVVHTIQ